MQLILILSDQTKKKYNAIFAALLRKNINNFFYINLYLCQSYISSEVINLFLFLFQKHSKQMLVDISDYLYVDERQAGIVNL